MWVSMSASPTNSLSVVSVFFGPILKLREVVKKYLKKKKIENRFISALETEAAGYIDAFEKLSDYGRDKVKPVLMAIKGIPNSNQITELVAVAAEVPLLYISLLRAFINLARACSEVSQIAGFMKSLEETHIVQFDFVKRMAAIYVPENSVVIDGAFFRYFKIYKDSFPIPKKEDAYVEVEDFRKSINYVKKWVENARTRKPRFAKKLCKRYMKNMKQLGTFTVKVTIKSVGTFDPQEYLPSSLKPLLAIIEEIFY